MSRAPETLPDAYPPARFRPLDGHAELAVAEAAWSGATRPERVTAVIAATVARLGSDDTDSGTARRVSAAGREWLLLRAAERFGRAPEWYETTCPGCGDRFDLRLSLADVPRARAGATFPLAEVDTSLGPRRFEAPNGAHEEAFARQPGVDPRRAFAALCGLSDDAVGEAAAYGEDDLDRIDAALEAASPEIADGVDAVCPGCGTSTRARMDPLTFAFPAPDAVLRQVHLIARAYRWGEAAILDLPLSRRGAYAALIEGDRGGPPSGMRPS